MTRVDFYYDVPSKLAIAVKLAHKAYSQQLPVAIYAPEPAMAEQIDRLLWTQPALGFLPHCRSSSPLAAETPVLIAESPEALGQIQQHQLLVNLDDGVPPGFERFERLIEIVGREEEDKAPARPRFKLYKDQGHDITRHDLSAR